MLPFIRLQFKAPGCILELLHRYSGAPLWYTVDPISDHSGPKHALETRHAVCGHLSLSAILRPCSYFILLCLHAVSWTGRP